MHNNGHRGLKNDPTESSTADRASGRDTSDSSASGVKKGWTGLGSRPGETDAPDQQEHWVCTDGGVVIPETLYHVEDHPNRGSDWKLHANRDCEALRDTTNDLVSVDVDEGLPDVGICHWCAPFLHHEDGEVVPRIATDGGHPTGTGGDD